MCRADAAAMPATAARTVMIAQDAPQTHIAPEDLRSHPVEVIRSLLWAVFRLQPALAMLAIQAQMGVLVRRVLPDNTK